MPTELSAAELRESIASRNRWPELWTQPTEGEKETP